MMLAELEAAGERAKEIKAALDALAKANEQLALLNRMAEERKDWAVNASWEPELILRKAVQYGVGAITVKIRIPFGVVQQQLVYAVEAARRRVVQLGGSLPAPKPKAKP